MQTAKARQVVPQRNQSEELNSLGKFRDQVEKSFVPLKISAQQQRSFSARLCSEDADQIAFTEIIAHPHLVERTPETIQHGGSGFYKVSLLLSGSSILVQDGKELVMNEGDLTIYDTSRPYSLLFNDSFRNLIMMLPKDRLSLPTPLTEQLTAVSLNQAHPAIAPLLSSYLSHFPQQLTSLTTSVRTKLANTSVDLLGTMLASILDAQPEQRDPHQALLRKISEYIDQNLSSPNLSPGSIAGAHFISTRHLHTLFRSSNSTVSHWIRERRLERCRADLLDPVLADRTISAIAARWGFTDAAHFSRVFKATYGHAPSDLRMSR